MTPGPGTYILPSDFGIYQAKEKFVAESEKRERLRASTQALPSNKRNSNGGIGRAKTEMSTIKPGNKQ